MLAFWELYCATWIRFLWSFVKYKINDQNNRSIRLASCRSLLVSGCIGCVVNLLLLEFKTFEKWKSFPTSINYFPNIPRSQFYYSHTTRPLLFNNSHNFLNHISTDTLMPASLNENAIKFDDQPLKNEKIRLLHSQTVNSKYIFPLLCVLHREGKIYENFLCSVFKIR